MVTIAYILNVSGITDGIIIPPQKEIYNYVCSVAEEHPLARLLTINKVQQASALESQLGSHETNTEQMLRKAALDSRRDRLQLLFLREFRQTYLERIWGFGHARVV